MIGTYDHPDIRNLAYDVLEDVPLEAVEFDPRNERLDGELDLDDLVSSLKMIGLQERVRLYCLDGERYLIASGHRRVAAARVLGWTRIPAVVTPPHDRAVEHEVSRLASNLCRKDIDPISLALSVQALQTQHSVSVQESARWLGKSTATITNLLRLLTLPADVQEMLRTEAITVGHALLLLKIKGPELDWFGNTVATEEECQIRLARAVVDEALSIKSLEVRVRNWLSNNIAINNWLHKQQSRPVSGEAHPSPLLTTSGQSSVEVAFMEDAESGRNATRARACDKIGLAVDFEDREGPSLDHLRLAALLLAEAVGCATENSCFTDQRDLMRQVEKAQTQLALVNIMGRLVNAAILDDINADGTDFVGNRRTRWAKSRFGLVDIMQCQVGSVISGQGEIG